MWGLVVNSSPNNNRRRLDRGTVSLQFLVIMVPVVLGFMGFAVDLGRIYLIRAELNQAASAMAMSAAAQLNGTSAATDTASAAAQVTLDNSLGDANKFNFGSLVVGQGSALLTSTVQQPTFFAALADALASFGSSNGSSADGTTARHVMVNLNADAPLTFFGLLSLGQSRKTSIAAAAIAGVSAPVCTACGIEPFAIAAVDATDPVDFGLVNSQLYTLAYDCTGNATLLAGTTGPALKYLLLDRFDTGSTFAEDQQLFRVGAQGLLPSNATPGWACSTVGLQEAVWSANSSSLIPVQACRANGNPVDTRISTAMCGLTSRMTDPTQSASCTSITDVGTIASAYTGDTDLNTITDYTGYAGNNVRLMTIPIVDALATDGTMTVLGFRQFLFEPTANLTPVSNNPGDAGGRFTAMYVGVVKPVKQGSISAPSCSIANGPGKVVLHQ